MERIRCGIFSAKTNMPFRAGKLAVNGALSHIFNEPPCLCLVFFSERYASPDLVEGILTKVSSEVVVGCSTSGEIASGYRRESVVANVLSSDYLRFGMATIDNKRLATGSKEGYKELYERALVDLQNKMILEETKMIVPGNLNDIHPDFGIVFLPGTDIDLEPKANEVILGLREQLGTLPLIGGTVADDCNYQQGYVICKGEFLEEHTVLILGRSDLKFSMVQRHGYSIKKEFKANRVHHNNLQLLDGRAAAEVYFEEINMPAVEISDLRDKTCALNPLGVIDEKTGELQLMFPMSRGKETSELTLSQVVPEGTKIFLAEVDIEKAKKAPLSSIKAAWTEGELKDPRFGLLFSCVGRSTFYHNRARREIKEIKDYLKYTDIGGAYFYGTICGASNWLSEGSASTLLIANDLYERQK